MPLSTVSSFDSVVKKFRLYAPKTEANLSLSLSSYFYFGSLIFCETEIYKIIDVISWKTNIEWRKPFIFEINEIKSGRVQEDGKGGGSKSLNLLHLWLKPIVVKKMGWGERLNDILLIQSATW